MHEECNLGVVAAMVRSFYTRTRISLVIHIAWALGFVVLVLSYLLFAMLLQEISKLRQHENIVSELYFNFPSQNILAGVKGDDSSRGTALCKLYALAGRKR